MSDEAGQAEAKTELRVLFEDSLKTGKSTKTFSLFGAAVDEIKDQNEVAPSHKRAKVTAQGPSLKDVFLAIQQRVAQKWPEPVGKKFVRTTDDKRKESKVQLDETKALLKDQSKKKIKAALRKTTSGTKPVAKKPRG